MPWISRYTTRGGIRYRVGYRVNGRKEHKCGFRTIQEAEKAGKAIKPKPVGGYTVTQVYRKYAEFSRLTKRPRTQEILFYAIRPFRMAYGPQPIKSLKSSDIERFKGSLLRNHKTNGINIILRNVKTFLQYALRLGYCETNPSVGVKCFKPEPVARFLNRQEMATIYRACGPALRRVLYTISYTGLRLGEFLAAKRSDLVGSGLRVYRTKTNRQRIIPIASRHKPIILSALENWNRDKLEMALRRMNWKAKIGRVRAHDLRHTFASNYLQAGGTIADLMAIMGHENLSTLQIYTHFSHSYLAARMEKMRFWGK